MPLPAIFHPSHGAASGRTAFHHHCGLSGRQSVRAPFRAFPCRAQPLDAPFYLQLRIVGTPIRAGSVPCNCAFPAGRSLWMHLFICNCGLSGTPIPAMRIPARCGLRTHRFFIIIAERRGRRSVRGGIVSRETYSLKRQIQFCRNLGYISISY